MPQFPSTNARLQRRAKKAWSLGHAPRENPRRLGRAREQGRIGGRRPKLSDKQHTENVRMVQKGNKTAADAARLFNIHPATVCRLLARQTATAT